MVAILISTYNGGKYIGEQLDSLLSQTYTDIKVFIRDDGSSDDTNNILREYIRNYPEKVIFYDSLGENLGAGKSFMRLLQITDADYYMFCDQDDVWMLDKVEKTLQKVQTLEQEYGTETPIGVFTDLMVVDSNLNIVMPSLWRGDNRHPEYTSNFYKQWTNRHATYGCTMLINNAAKKIVFPYHQYEGVIGGHDVWVEYILIKKGVYRYIDEPTIYYRQHGTNVIGANLGITYRDEVNGLIGHPINLFRKLRKDYIRTRIMPFKISYVKVLWYRIYQSFLSLIK